MDPSVELLDRQTKRGFTERQVSIASFDSSAKSLGKPSGKPYCTLQDIYMLGITFSCLLIGILAVADVSFAGFLGQKDQLILLGLLLSLMAACAKKQIQLFLLTFEARFGASTLQNYDSILRYSMLDTNISILLQVVLVLVFALPLVLSASYKQFVNGVTALPLKPIPLTFGPVGPPGLEGGALWMMLNATLPLFVTQNAAFRLKPLHRTNESATAGSFGFNTQILSENSTALIDTPLVGELAKLSSLIKADEILEFSSYVNATICTLNSTSDSPERADPEYWSKLAQSGLQPPNTANYGTNNMSFGGATGKYDYSFLTLSLWDTQNDTYESEAVVFNLFRGQCHATWHINQQGTTTLQDARNCTPAPQLSHPCNGSKNVTSLHGSEAFQAPITCNTEGVSEIAVWPFFDLLWLQPISPVWISAVASMAWAELSYYSGPAERASNTPDVSVPLVRWPVLKYEASVELIKNI